MMFANWYMNLSTCFVPVFTYIEIQSVCVTVVPNQKRVTLQEQTDNFNVASPTRHHPEYQSVIPFSDKR